MTDTAAHPSPAVEATTRPVDLGPQAVVPELERRGRWWLALSFLACPCHLPLTLGVLAAVLGGTALGTLVRDNSLVAGLVIGSVWLAGTARGLWLIRRGQREGFTCPTPR